MTDAYFGPAGCTDTGYACFPYLILGELSPDGTSVTVKEPSEIKKQWPSVAAVLVARCEDDQKPRHLTKAEILTFVAKSHPKAAKPHAPKRPPKRTFVAWLRSLIAG
ncbi:MAG: hypothetical protein WC612_04845 [Bdellovibrionales bacterium]|jgi:hypothetical protein